MKAEAMSKFSIMALKISLDFEKQTMNKGIINLLANGLQDDLDKDVRVKECLDRLAKGKKLPYMAANYLLANLLNSLTFEDSDPLDEITLEPLSGSQTDAETGADESIIGSTESASGSRLPQGGGDKPDKEHMEDKLDKKVKTPKYGKKESPPEDGKTKEEVCRFYTNGKCKYKFECRFQHPKICTKFRQHGDCEVKGCGGDCDFFHPNVCRSSLKDKTCSYSECKFFHLKGTATVVRESKWRTNNPAKKSEQRGTNKTGASSGNNASKNRQPGLTPRTKNKNPNQKSNKKPPPNEGTVTKKEKTQLSHTL